jgi:hypothetical protein
MSITGLGNVTSIGLFIRIEHNPNLPNLSGLNNLTSVGGSITLDDNNLLNDLSAFGNLTNIPKNLIIWSYPNLQTLPDLII